MSNRININITFEFENILVKEIFFKLLDGKIIGNTLGINSPKTLNVKDVKFPLSQILFPTLRNSDCVVRYSDYSPKGNGLEITVTDKINSLKMMNPLPLGVKKAVRCIVFANSLQECLDAKESVEEYLDENSLSMADFQLYKAVVPSDITRTDFDMIFVHPAISPMKYSDLITAMLSIQPNNNFDNGNIITLNL